MDDNCEYMDKCPMFQKFEAESILRFWIQNFCKGEHEKCQRKVLRKAGKEVPLNLLPNGTFLTKFTDHL